MPDIHNGAYRRKYDKAMSGKSLRAAVDMKCLDCMCWQSTEIRNCNAVSCPLHPYRPYKDSLDNPQDSYSARQKARGAVATEQTGVDG